MYMHKEDSALNNLQFLICHKTKPYLYLHINTLVTKILMYTY